MTVLYALFGIEYGHHAPKTIIRSTILGGSPKMPVIVNKRLLDAKEAADYLSISRAKLYEWMKKGKIRSLLIDTSRRFDVVDLDGVVDKLKEVVD
jgi:excisionase family DNA binding protein